MEDSKDGNDGHWFILPSLASILHCDGNQVISPKSCKSLGRTLVFCLRLPELVCEFCRLQHHEPEHEVCFQETSSLLQGGESRTASNDDVFNYCQGASVHAQCGEQKPQKHGDGGGARGGDWAGEGAGEWGGTTEGRRHKYE